MYVTDSLSTRHHVVLAIGACLASFLVSVDSFIINVALPTIAGELGVRSEIAYWLLTVYVLPYTISVPLAGNLATRHGNKPVFLIGLFIFMVGSLLCGFTPNYTFLLASRMIQGFGAGMIVPSSRGVIVLNFPPNKRVLPMTLWSFAVMVGPAFGPVIGGLLSNVHWHWLFFSAIPLALICYFAVDLTPILYAEKRDYALDWMGLVFAVIFVLALQVILDRGQLYDWLHSKIIVTCLIIMPLALIVFIVWELSQENPMVYIQAFAKRSFTIATLSNCLALSCIFASFSLDVYWLHDYLGYPPLWAGLSIVPLGLFPLLTYPFMAFAVKKCDPRFLTSLGLCAFIIGFILKSRINLDTTFAYLCIAHLIEGIGFPLLTAPNSLMCIQGFKDEKLPMVIATYSFTRMLASSLGVSLGMILWIHRRAFYQTRLAARTYLESERFTSFLSEIKPVATSTEQLYGIANQEVIAQAATLALADIYYLFIWITASAFFLTLAYRVKKPVPA